MKAAAGLAASGFLAGCTGGDGNGGTSGGESTTGGGETTTSSGGTTSESGGGSLEPGAPGLEEGDRPVAHLGHITYAYPEQEKKFESIYDINVKRTIVSYAGIQQKLFSGGNKTFDVAGFEGIIARPALVFNDFSEGVPTSRLDESLGVTPWSEENIADIFTKPTERLSHIGKQAELLANSLWADPSKRENLKLIPTNYNMDSVGYNPKFIEPGSVSTWGEMFKPEYNGKVALGVVPVISVAEAIMYLMDKGTIDKNVDTVNNPTKDQIDTAVDYLIKQKQNGQFRALWGQTGRSAELMASEEAVIGNIWQPAVFSVRSKGTPCSYATMSKGIQGFALTTGGFIPTKPGSKSHGNYDEALAWTHMHHGAWYADFVQKRTGYSVPTYPNKDLIRDGSDETGQGMGPEFYDWAYEGKATYDAVDNPSMFQPDKYDWSMEEGEPDSNGQKRDGGSIGTRTDRVGTWYTWPDEGTHLQKRWKEFTSA